MVKLLKTLTLLAAALFSATAWSQYAQYTVATLPNPIGYPPTVTVQATDGANAQDCKVGGGNYTVNCNAFRGQWLPSISGSGNPGGSTGQAQYNNAGAFGGSPFTLDASGNATVPAGAGINMQAVADPGAGLTAILAGLGAGNVDNGIHDYAMTCTTAAGTTGAAPHTSVTVTDNTTNGQVALTGIPVCDSPLVTSKQLYRTLAGIDCVPGNAVNDYGVTGCAYYALGAPLDPAATTYTDNTADADIESNPLIPLSNTTPGGISVNGIPTFYAGNFAGIPALSLPNFQSQAIGLIDNSGMNPDGYQGAIFSCGFILGSDSCLWFEGISGGDLPGIYGEADVLASSVTVNPAIAWYAYKEGANPGDPSAPLGAGDMLWGVNNQNFDGDAGCSNTTALVYGDGTFCVHGPLDTASPQTTVNCSTSGTVVYSQPLQGISDKKVVAVLAACLGTAATYTFPTAFTVAPDYFIGRAATGAVVSAISTTAVTITITGTAISGTITLEGY